MKALWLFVFLIIFCIYVLFGLYLTENTDSLIQLILTWVIYTILWTTFINVFLLGYFWSVVKDKTGPVGLRGPLGERGKVGVEGQCSITAGQAYCMKALNDYIDELYKSKSGKSILDEELQKFPNNYLNNKISVMAGSRQYQVLLANLSSDNKPIDNLINYLKSIWSKWFDLIYNGTDVTGVWFTDVYADEQYNWIGETKPFDEIKKYDIYYWGITRNFRPLKAELCRSNPKNLANSKFPKHQLSQDKNKQVNRLKVIQTNDYYKTGDTENNDDNYDGSFWSPHTQTIDGETYYPVGDVMAFYTNYAFKYGKTIVGDSSYDAGKGNGPDIRTILVSGDVVDPLYYIQSADIHAQHGERIQTPICPKGYTSLGDVVTSEFNGYTHNSNKCLPTECLEKVAPGPMHAEGGNNTPQWNRYDKYLGSDLRYHTTWYSNINSLNYTDLDAKYKNGYNLIRGGESLGWHGYPYYKIKKKCLEKIPNRAFPPLPVIPDPLTKEVEPEFEKLGIGWNGHPYKLDPKYSIFSYLNLVPEGMIVNQGTGQRFYIVHKEGFDINIFNIIAYNNNSNKFDGYLKVNYMNIDDPNDKTIPNNKKYKNNSNISPSIADLSEPIDEPINFNPPPKRVIVTEYDKTNMSQDWKIILNDNKKLFKLKNMYNNTYLLISQESREGLVEFSSINLDNNKYLNDPAFKTMEKYELDNRTDFSFISSFGTQLDIIDKDDNKSTNFTNPTNPTNPTKTNTF